jgi:YidC/Oxa1 family membrane protein insertase
VNAWELIIQQPLINVLIVIASVFWGNFGLSIIALTIFINLAMLPLTLSQIRSSKKMMDLQPKLTELQKKYAKDKQKLAQEQMKLYKEAGINPLGGCLPLLIQMPIWFGLINAIRYCIPTTPLEVFQFSHHIYKWLPGVVGIVPLQSTFLGMDLGLPPSPAQWWSYSLPILVFVTSWLQQKLLTPPTAADDRSQAAVMNKQMQTMMPLMMMFFTLSYSTGLSIYFIISSLVRMVQYYFVQRNQHEEKDRSKRPAPLKKKK